MTDTFNGTLGQKALAQVLREIVRVGTHASALLGRIKELEAQAAQDRAAPVAAPEDAQHMTVNLDIPTTAAERVAQTDAERECQCPICGRLHRKLASNPPASIAQRACIAESEVRDPFHFRKRAEEAERKLAEALAGAARLRAALEAEEQLGAVVGSDFAQRRADALADDAGKELLEAANATLEWFGRRTHTAESQHIMNALAAALGRKP